MIAHSLGTQLEQQPCDSGVQYEVVIQRHIKYLYNLQARSRLQDRPVCSARAALNRSSSANRRLSFVECLQQ